jgi:hypothetical protein
LCRQSDVVAGNSTATYIDVTTLTIRPCRNHSDISARVKRAAADGILGSYS